MIRQVKFVGIPVAVQDAVRHLTRRRLIAVERDSPTATPRYAVLRPWIRR
ncbi:MAG: hypothetical protein LC780_14150 [Acidobacteria bacterium]|nr:hypothetical protein [Acidobacteriota bacterium]